MKPGCFCPLIRRDCVGLKCSWFTQLRGHNANTGAEVDEWGCAVTWVPVLLIENAQQSRQTGAAVESLRNRTADAAERLASLARATVPSLTAQ